MKQIIAGILAHVDAGKTTLSEALYIAVEALKNRARRQRRCIFRHGCDGEETWYHDFFKAGRITIW